MVRSDGQLMLSAAAKHNVSSINDMPERIKHGYARRGQKFPKSYRVWRIMVRRCTDPNLPKYKDYGGRGITICERWKEFSNFLADMGECPDELSIERKDNNAGYSKENCKWASAREQANNKRTNVVIQLRGVTASVASHCHTFGITNYATVLYRLHEGWEPERAFFSPPGPTSKRY